MWPMAIAACVCVSPLGEPSCVSSAMWPPTCSSESLALGAPLSTLVSAVSTMRASASDAPKSIWPRWPRAPLEASWPTAPGTKETLAMAERAHCCTCARCEPSSGVSAPRPPVSARAVRNDSSAANWAMACTAWYDVSDSPLRSATSPGRPPIEKTVWRRCGCDDIDAIAPAAGPLARPLELERMLTRCGSVVGCSSWWRGMAPDEQRLPKVMAAYDLSSCEGWSSSSRIAGTQPLSTIAPACWGCDDSCESAESAWSCERMSSARLSCSASMTIPPLS